MKPRQVLSLTSSYTQICERLSKLTTSNICDAFPQVRLLDSKISPIGNREQCVGLAYTVNSAQDSLSIMQGLDDLHAFLATFDPLATDITPTILMIASCGAPYALVGGMCANTAKLNGFSGVITDGPCRDIYEIRQADISIFARGKCAKSGNKDKVGTIKQPINCGGAQVDPGDIILADVDGIVAMSKQEAISAIVKAESIQVMEELALQRLIAGAKFKDICNIDEHVENLQAGVESKLKLKL